MSEHPVIIIVGPTGVGKSDAAVSLALRNGGEIISCDAMQVYREVNIACDKPSDGMRKSVPHHLIDIVSVTEEFDASRFRQAALVAIADIKSRNKTPIVCGGSGMYMTVLLDGIFEDAAKDEDLRQRLAQEVKEQGAPALHTRLAKLDPIAAEKIHPNNAHRILRALEVSMVLGRPISEAQKERQGIWGQMPIKIVGLDRPREELYARVEARIEKMFEEGLVEEVRGLSNLSLSRTAAGLIGIPEVAGYLKGEYDTERAKYLMKLNTRHYVKRQLTWFRRDKRIVWIDLAQQASSEDIINRIKY